MQSENRLFDDFVKVMNGAAGTFAGMAREAEARDAGARREWIGGLDFVSREEFEAVKAMAAAAREEDEALKARLDALEAQARAGSAGRARPCRARGHDSIHSFVRGSPVRVACAQRALATYSAAKAGRDGVYERGRISMRERDASAPIDMLEHYFSAHGWALRAQRRRRDRRQLPGQLDAI